MHDSWQRKVKIVCTLGPATSDPEMIRRLIDAGMDVARLNFSHGSHAFHAGLFASVRKHSEDKDRLVGILQDLQGPKIRLGVLPKAGVTVVAGEEYVLHPEGSDLRTIGKGKKALPISAEIALPISKDVSPGATILFDDGKISSRVKAVSPPEIVIEIVTGGTLYSNKGMNLPGTPLRIPCITEKDLEDLKLGVKLGVDAVALSFVRSAEDIEFVRKQIERQSTHQPLVIAKMEREEAVRNQDSIIEVADGLLVARGDMAVELGVERVPIIQKQLIRSCNELGVPIITATQMLESMIASPTPTRAEATDVANAVFDGTDAVMLSGETAAGQYPIETVKVMAKIIVSAEKSADQHSLTPALKPLPGSIVESIEYSVARIANHVGAVAIACITHSGRAVRALAKYRPTTPIVAITESPEALRKLAVVWGVNGILLPKLVGTDDLFQMLEKVLVENQFAAEGDLFVVSAGVPTLKRGTTNMIKVHRVGSSTEKR